MSMQTGFFRSLRKAETIAAILLPVTVFSVITFHSVQRAIKIEAGLSDWRTGTSDDRKCGGTSAVKDLSTEDQLKFSYRTEGSGRKAYATFC